LCPLIPGCRVYRESVGCGHPARLAGGGSLSAQGWPEKEVYNALADHDRWLTGVDIPHRSGAGTSAREADRAIELVESKNGTFFDTGDTVLNANGRELLTVLAEQLSSVPNSISIGGHTDSLPYANDKGYGN